MIDKQKIQEAANNYIGHESDIDEGCNVSARREAFKGGINWFKKNIWHNATEQPTEFTPILVQWLDVGKCYEIDSASWTDDWEEHCNRNHIMAWCYISDLLP